MKYYFLLYTIMLDVTYNFLLVNNICLIFVTKDSLP